MLNPRVSNFKPAPVNLTLKRGNISDNCGLIIQTIESHFYNYCVTLVLPDSMTIPQHISQTLNMDSEYYKVMSVRPHLFITQDFIDYFVKGGEVSALSVNTCLDSDNCIALTPSGHLVLSIDKNTFQHLGLIKGPAIDIRKNKGDTYVIIINLKTECFKIGSKNYERAYRNLLGNSSLKFDVILTWEPKDPKICPSSIAKYFVRHGTEVKECSVEETKSIMYSVKFPSLLAEDEELMEWFGALIFGITESSSTENHDFMVFESPEPNEEIGQVAVMNWTGLFSRQRLISFFKEFRKLAADLNEVPWVGFSVLGYLDTPVSWGLRPHAFRTSGENDYTIFLNHKGDFLLCKNTETCSAR